MKRLKWGLVAVLGLTACVMFSGCYTTFAHADPSDTMIITDYSDPADAETVIVVDSHLDDYCPVDRYVMVAEPWDAWYELLPFYIRIGVDWRPWGYRRMAWTPYWRWHRRGYWWDWSWMDGCGSHWGYDYPSYFAYHWRYPDWRRYYQVSGYYHHGHRRDRPFEGRSFGQRGASVAHSPSGRRTSTAVSHGTVGRTRRPSGLGKRPSGTGSAPRNRGALTRPSSTSRKRGTARREDRSDSISRRSSSRRNSRNSRGSVSKTESRSRRSSAVRRSSPSRSTVSKPSRQRKSSSRSRVSRPSRSSGNRAARSENRSAKVKPNNRSSSHSSLSKSANKSSSRSRSSSKSKRSRSRR